MKQSDIVKTKVKINGIPQGTRATLIDETLPGIWIVEGYFPMSMKEFQFFSASEHDLELVEEV